MKVSVLIANWNGRHFLPTCLESLAAQSFRDFETIVVDNGSTDGSLELLRDRGGVRTIELPENRGFSVANNLGLQAASGELIVTLNNDTRAEPGWLEELVAVAEAHPRAGMVASRTCVWDQPDVIDTLGGRICRDGMSRGALRGRNFSSLGLGPVVPVLYPSPTAALYRRAMLEETGFFDEEFFAYGEDTDLGLRGRWHGWDCVAATTALVHHRFSGTGGTFSPFKLYLCERNHYWIALKNFPRRWLAGVPWFTLARYLEQVRAVRAAEGSGAEFRASAERGPILRALARGTLDAFKGLPGMLAKRRRLMARRRVDEGEMVRLLQRHRLSFRELLDRGDHRAPPMSPNMEPPRCPPNR